MTIIGVSACGAALTEQQRRLCLHNITACQAYRAGLVKLPPLNYQPIARDYVAKPLATPLPLAVPAKRKRYRGPSELKRRAERSAAHKPVEQPLVTMVAIAPPPPSSLLPA